MIDRLVIGFLKSLMLLIVVFIFCGVKRAIEIMLDQASIMGQEIPAFVAIFAISIVTIIVIYIAIKLIFYDNDF